jgi:rod shape determining protein RodA
MKQDTGFIKYAELGRKLLRINWILIAAITIIASVGFVALYSAAGGSFMPWAEPQIMRYILGLLMLTIIAMINVRVWLLLSVPIYTISLLMLAAVPLFGAEISGSTRWLSLAGISFQPSEAMKISMIMAIAAYYSYIPESKVSSPLYLVTPLVIIALPVILVIRQPDLGTAILLGIVGLMMLFLAGVSWFYYIAGVAIAGFLLPYVWDGLHAYQKGRILTFIDPERDPYGAGYHIIQSKIAIGSGGINGKGLMNGTQSQLNFLPEKHTDFIFTMLAEETGFMGGVSLIALYAVTILLLIYMAIRCRDMYSGLVISGVCISIFMYVLINIAMVIGLAPVVGLPLPLVSYGGTSMLVFMVSIGMAMSGYVHRERPEPKL